MVAEIPRIPPHVCSEGCSTWTRDRDVIEYHEARTPEEAERLAARGYRVVLCGRV